MITVVNFENMGEHKDILGKIMKLRYQEFILRQNYKVPSYKNMEYDQFDNPTATYLAYIDKQGNVLGTSRHTPTTENYMIETIWPSTLPSLPKNNATWEYSRFCIDSNRSKQQREVVMRSLIIAALEFAISQGATRYIGVMYPRILTKIQAFTGWHFTLLGEEKCEVTQQSIMSWELLTNSNELKKMRTRFGINAPLLSVHQNLC